jgi:TolA protein
MRTGVTVSAIVHAGLIVLAIVGLGSGRPLETPPVESIAVDLVPVSEFTNIRQGALDSTVVDTETPSAVDSDKPAELAKPTGNTAEDQPTPADNAKVTPAPTENTAPPPPTSTPEPEPDPAPATEPPAPASRPAPAPAAEPTPEPDAVPAEAEPTPPDPTLASAADATDPADAVPKPAARTASLADKRAAFKKQQQAEKDAAAAEARAEADAKAKADADAKAKADADAKAVADAKAKADAEKKKAADKKKADDKKKAEEQATQQAQADTPDKVADEIANILNQEESRGATTGEGGQKTLGKETGRAATLSQSEISALVAQIRDCIALPAGAEEADARAEFLFTIGADGMVTGRPQMLSSPANGVESTYANAIARALMRCGPYTMAAGQDVRAQFAARAF